MPGPIAFTHDAADRFLRYVRIDTQSDVASATAPSTDKQKDLGRLLVAELLELGAADAHLDAFGLVYATIPATTAKQVPVICFCAHLDTAPDVTGTGVKPQLVRNYRGGDLILPGDTSQVIRVAEHPELLKKLGHDIVTTDGTTLLGADDKAGVTAIMDAARFLLAHPELEHGAIRVLFTPDEEIGRGADHVELKKLGASFAYTLDGGPPGEIEDESFCANAVTITIEGVSAHPGYGKGKIEHAIKIAAAIVGRLPLEISPEATEGRDGFLHPVRIEGSLESATLVLIVRDFTEQGLVDKQARLEAIVREVMAGYPRSTYTFTVAEQYRNMKVVLDRHPEVMDNARAAIRRAGLVPFTNPIRGGTDGSRLSFMGLPCPNLFCGEHAIHSRLEWASVQDIEKAPETVVHLAMIWAENA